MSVLKKIQIAVPAIIGAAVRACQNARFGKPLFPRILACFIAVR
jgi:hypothetical protein